jgi:hypothetical protein
MSAAVASRRNLLTGASAVLLAGAAIAAAHGAEFQKPDPLPWRNGPRPPEPPVLASDPDAELIALLATLKQQNATIAAIEEEGEHLPDGITDASRDQERRMDEAADFREAIFASISATPAGTPVGMRAKAEALCTVIPLYSYVESGETLDEIAEGGDSREVMALSLARDVLAWRAGA